MNELPDDLLDHIFSFRSYEEMLSSGCDNIISLSKAIKIQYGTFSFIKYIRGQIKSECSFHVPLIIYDKIRKKLPLSHEKFIHLTPELMEIYKDKWNWHRLSENISLTSYIIEI